MQWRNETVGERRKRISLDLYRRVNGVVKYGSFEGMKLVKENWWSKADLGSQFLGLYEKEILNIINKVKRHEYNTFIDIMPLVCLCPIKYQNVFVLKSQSMVEKLLLKIGKRMVP